jgi:hypothetical protein
VNTCTTCGRSQYDARATWTTCQACQTRIERQLGEIEQLWRALPDHLEPTRGHSGPRVSGSARDTAPLPAVEAVLELMGPAGVPTRLYWRYADLAVARGLAPRPAAAGADYRFAQAVRGIRRHLPWAAQGADLADLARELGKMLGELVAVTGGIANSPTVPCPAELPDGGTCTGRLRYDTERKTAYCRTCRTELDPSEWLGYWMALGAAPAG